MTNVVWLAAHSRTPLSPERVHRWVVAAEATLGPRVGGLTRAEAGGDHTLVVAWSEVTDPPSWGPQVEADGERLAIHDGYPIGFERLGLERPSAFAIGSMLERDATAIERLLPPYANVVIDAGRLTISLDTLGFAKVYRVVIPGLSVWSNSALLASLFAFGVARLSEEGWTSLVARDAFLGATTPYAGVQLEGPGATVIARDEAAGLSVQRPVVGGTLFQAPTEDVGTAVDRALHDVFSSIARLDPGPLTVTLSGGRDSRLLAAIALELDLVAELWTSSPPELDLEIAGRLIEHLDRPIAWTTRDKTAATRERDRAMLESGADTAALWDRLIRYQLVGEGEGETTLHTAPARPRRSLDRPFVWGIGAELGRAFYYRHGDTLHPASAVRAFWETVADGGRLVDPLAAHDLLVPLARALRSSMDDAGVTGLHQLDHFYVFQRVRRLQNRLGTTSGLRPYFTVPYARATLGRPPAERVRMTYHEALVARAYPAWAGIPYSHERGRSRSSSATAQSYAEVFWESPYAARLHAEVMDAIRAHPFVHRGEARRLLELGGRRDGLSVQRMRDLNRLLDLVSFDRHLGSANAAFVGAGGVAASERVAPPPATSAAVARGPTEAARIRAGARVRRWRRSMALARIARHHARRLFRLFDQLAMLQALGLRH